VFEWTIALFFVLSLIKVDLSTEREMLLRYKDSASSTAHGSPAVKSDARLN